MNTKTIAIFALGCLLVGCVGMDPLDEEAFEKDPVVEAKGGVCPPFDFGNLSGNFCTVECPCNVGEGDCASALARIGPGLLAKSDPSRILGQLTIMSGTQHALLFLYEREQERKRKSWRAPTKPRADTHKQRAGRQATRSGLPGLSPALAQDSMSAALERVLSAPSPVFQHDSNIRLLDDERLVQSAFS